MTQTNVNTGGASQAYYGRDGSITNSPNIRADHTIAVRVRHTSTATNYDSICVALATSSAGNASGSYVGRFNGDPSTAIAFYRFNGVATFNTTSPTGAYGDTTSWTHLCLVYDSAAALIRPYINGVAQTTVSSATTFVTSTTATGISIGGPHPGVFCDAAFFGRVLTASEVLDLANIRRPRNMSSCFGWYPEFSDGITQDWSGNGNTLSILNSGTGTNPTVTNENPPKPFTSSHFYVIAPPEISRAITGAGSVQTTGAASVNRMLDLAGTGTTNTTGAASVPANKALNGTGTTQTSASSGGLTASAAVVGTGTVQATGAAALTAAAAITGAATVNTTGAGALSSAAALVGAGLAQTSGAAALAATAGLGGSGTTQVTGAASVSSGSGADIGSAGSIQTSGSAALSAAAAADSSGTSQTTGAGALTVAAALTGAGTTRAQGSAVWTSASALQGSGTSQVIGAATLTSSVVISAVGATNTTGAALWGSSGFPIVAAGSTLTNGVASVANSAQPFVRNVSPLSRRFLHITGRRMSRTR